MTVGNAMNKKALIVAIGLAGLPGWSPAAETEGSAELRGAIRGLVDELVKGGVLPKNKADAVVERALERARREAAPAGESGEPLPGGVRVPYIPEPVKKDIIEQIRPSVREDVVQEILKQARQERWGVPDAFPAWVNRIAFFGDIRLREQVDKFAPDNAPSSYLNIQKINQQRSVSSSLSDFLNTTEDHSSMRLRARVGMLAKVSDDVSAVVRVATGSTTTPVSTNDTFTNSFNSASVILDQGYLRYQSSGKAVTLWGGRVPNPFLTTDLVWSDNLNFDGVAATIRRAAGDPNVAGSGGFAPFWTIGAFPLQVTDWGKYAKWLYATQLGVDWRIGRSVLSFGTSYYYFSNIVGRANALNDNSLDYTAPQFVQKGNTMYEIEGDLAKPLFGLASDFHEFDVIGSLDIGAFGATHVILTGHYVRNTAFDVTTVTNRINAAPIGGRMYPGDLADEASGYLAKLTVGAPKLEKHGDWQVTWGYKRLGANAVVDAFTDTDFHLGGTDAQGWFLGGSYTLANNTWVSLRYLTSDAIQYAPLGIDTWQLEINARF